MRTIELQLNGYWTDKEQLPNQTGIYFVYRATPTKYDGDKIAEINVHELLYIGKADDQTIYERHQHHNRQADFDAALLDNEILCYLTAINIDELDRVENGLIFKRQPRLNNKLKKTFNYPDTHFVLNSKRTIADMFDDFTLKKYDK